MKYFKGDIVEVINNNYVHFLNIGIGQRYKVVLSLGEEAQHLAGVYVAYNGPESVRLAHLHPSNITIYKHTVKSKLVHWLRCWSFLK